MTNLTKNEQDRELKINRRLKAIHDRIAWMADAEYRGAWVNGPAADGRLWDEKERLLDEAEAKLKELESFGGSPAFVPPGETL